jgi:predicted nucleic acid-binding protein
METLDCTVILDDYKARVVAEKLGLTITGTIGVIIKAKLKGIIVSIKPMLAKLRKTEFRFSDEVEQNALKAANE